MQKADAHEGERGAWRVAFVTMGCAKNEVDTAAMEKRLLTAGYAVTPDVEDADVIVVNTCSFIQSATEESLEAVFEAARLPRVAAGSAHVVVAGCMPARYGADLEEELTEAAAFVPCSREDDIVAVVGRCLGVAEAGAGVGLRADEPAREGAGEASADGAPAGPAGSASPSAYVKISDGCDRWCSYCAIPLIRGRYHSFPVSDIRANVAEHVAAGTREIVLIAQDTGRYGQDFDEPSTLARLVADLAEEFPRTWFRVMYLQPEGVTDELLAVMAGHDNVCSYLDIPLQHVDEALLRAMNRRGSRAQFEALIKRVRAAVPDVTLRTTLIAGFPGETDEQFEDLCDFVAEAPFDYVGVFAYSREEGTRAFDLPDQVDEDEKADRAQRLRDIADAACTARVAERVGRTVRVLVEGCEEDGQLFGRAQCQAPEVDGVTYLDAGEVGSIVEVRVSDTLMYEMEAE
ncbi:MULTISPECIES: 30S ribosomal protein S12 methylthiotransferase RimO [unclassified Adlercreutzia]|uniref:30S ribosomal protein S12 methylthiotransferase RimO n=1 Tax=unclassified Adlercreutzia TaxID=2636013 RepID=UPI0013EAF499|nr:MULTISPECIES: 30S ribosomal protein S12 methylthiotransferase RimO [unclassified Adlercreutzia]